jgi:hypothetical protein
MWIASEVAQPFSSKQTQMHITAISKLLFTGLHSSAPWFGEGHLHMSICFF